jgi:hypothetical protein
MDPTFSFDNDQFQGWLLSSVDSAGQRLVEPQTILALVLLVLAIGVMALVVASFDTSEEGQAIGPGPRFASSALAGIGDACAWVCAWNPRPKEHRHRVHKHHAPASRGAHQPA